MATTLANKRGELESWFWTFSKIVFPINFLLCSQFRQCFAIISYVNPRGHTAGFLGLQLALILTAIQNMLFVYDTNTAYEKFGSTHKERLENTRMWALIYVIGDLLVSIPKMQTCIYVVFYGHTTSWAMKKSFISELLVGQVLDYVWMIFNAVIPLFISYFRSTNEKPIKIVFSQDAAPYLMDETEVSEKSSLTSTAGPV